MNPNIRFAQIIGWPGIATAIVDAFCVVLAALLAIPVANFGDIFGPVYLPLGEHYRLAIVATTFIAVSIFFWTGAYRAWRGSTIYAEIRLLLLGWVLVFLMLAAAALATKTGAAFSRQWVIAWFCVGLLLLCLVRLCLRVGLNLLRHRGYDQKRIVLVGGGELAETVAVQVLASRSSGLVIVGYFDDADCGSLAGQVARLGGVDDIVDWIDRIAHSASKVDEVWLAMNLSRETRIEQALEQLHESSVDVRLVPDVFGYRLLNHSVEQLAGVAVVNLSKSPMDQISRITKRAEDIVLGCLMLLVTMPAMLAIAMAIRYSSPGPVIYRQVRQGWDGKQFSIYKFRTMTVPSSGALDVYVQAEPGDVRITPIGQWLRRFSLDELPQVFNVLRGEMSVVGPRPHPVEQNRQFLKKVRGYMMRHKVKPGITGWAQVNGLRGMTDTVAKMEARVEYDLHYIENWSLWFDIKIVLLSVVKGFAHSNAH